MFSEPTVFVVDDDEALLESVRWLIESDGLNVKIFDTPKTFLKGFPKGAHGCLLLDIRMPGMSGLELQETLNTQNFSMPVIFITGHGDVPMAVRAMKMGAFDFLIKPFNDQSLLESIHRALAQDASQRDSQLRFAEIAECIKSLTPREREVMEHVVSGQLNKNISGDLGIGTKTVEIHRSRIMKKMKTRSLAELVKMVMLYRYYKKDNL